MRLPVLKEKRASPKLSPASLVPEKKAQGQKKEKEEDASQDKQAQKKRPGSGKRQKTANLIIHETQLIQPNEEIPTGSEFKGYQDYTVQELIVRAHNTLYRLAIWQKPTVEYIKGKLPESVRTQGHFGVIREKLLALPISSLPRHPTEALKADERMGHRHLIGTVEPHLGGRQR